jgi:gliding motility-associated-like protein
VVTLNNTPPNVNAGPDKVLTCTVTQVTLEGSSTTPGVTYQWTTVGGNIVSGGNTATPTVNAAGTYTLTVTNPVNGCTSTDATVVTLNNTPPNVNAGPDKVLTCTVTQVTLEGSSTTPGVTYQWTTVGGNIVSGGNTATPTVNAAGTYTLTVTNPVNGCTSTDATVVTLNNTPPNVNAGPDKILTCTVTQVILEGSSTTPGVTYQWTTVGGNIVSGGNTATPTVNAAGTYTLTVTNPVNGCTSTDATVVTLNNTPPNVNAGPDKILTCTVTQVILEGSSTTPGVTYQWTTVGGNIVSGGNTATPTVNAAGTYTLTVTNPVNGCTSTDATVVTLNSTPPNVNAGPDKVLTCVVMQVILEGSSTTPGVTYQWTTVDGNIVSGGNTATPTVNAAGTYTLTVTNPVNGCTAVDVALVTMDETLPTAYAGTDSNICQTEDSFTLSGSDATFYSNLTWSTSGTGTFNDIHILHPVYTPGVADIAAGSVILTLTATNGLCDPASDQMVLTIIPSPIVNAGPDAETCVINAFTVSGATATNYSSLLWTENGLGSLSNAGTLNPTYTPAPNESGTVKLKLMAYGNGSCAAVADSMLLQVTPMPVANAGPDGTTCEVTAYQVSGAQAFTYNYVQWTTTGLGTLSGSNTLTPTYTPAAGETGTILLMLTAYGNGSCPATMDEMTLTIYQKPVAFAGDDAAICQGGSYTIADSYAENSDGLLWTSNGPGLLTGATTLHPAYFPLPGETGLVTFTLLVYADDGVCPDVTDQMVLTIKPVATADAGPDDSQCGTTPYALDGSSMTNAVSVLWSSSGTGTFDNPTQLHATYTPSSLDVQNGSVTLTLTATAGSPCPPVSDQMVLTLAVPATVNAGDEGIICEGNQFTVTTASAGNYSSLVWTTTDGMGTILNPQTLTPTYVPYPGEVGVIHLRLTASGIGLCPDVMDEMTLTIISGPSVEAGENVTLCEGTPYTANAEASHFTALLWTADGEGTLMGETTLTPTYVPAEGETGMVKLTLTVNGEAPCGSVSDYILLGYVPAARAFAGPDEEVCENTDFVDSLVYVEHVTEVKWVATGVGTLHDANTLTPWYEPAPGEIGDILLILTAYAYEPCPPVTDTMVLTIHPAIQVIGLTDDAICQGDIYTLEKISVENFTSITWTSSGTGQFDDPSSDHPTYTPSSGDVFDGFVILTATIEALGECEDRAVSMRLDILSTPTSNAGTDGAICQGETFMVLDASTGNNTGIQWTTSGDGTFNDATLLNPVYTPGTGDVAAGKVTLTLTAQGAGSCGDATDGLLLTIHHAPVADAGTDQQIELSTSTQLNGSASGGSGSYTYLWAPPGLLENPASRNPITKILSDTTQFTLTVIDKNTGCQSEDIMTVFTLIPNRPPVAVDDYDSTDVDMPVTIDISVNDFEPDNDGITYEFCGGPYRGTFVYNGDGTITYTPSAGFAGIDSLCYRICDDRIPSLCDQATVYIFIQEEDCFHIYNGITPNGDGFNDTWYIECIDLYPENEVIIINRWFDVVKHMKNYDNTNVFWDGTNEDGEILPDGTYFYVIKLAYLGQEKVHTGWIFVHSNNE